MVVPCNFCGIQIPREKLKEHTDVENGDCTKKMRPCIFAAVGCNILVEMEGEASHNESEIHNHMHLLRLKIEQLNEAKTTMAEDKIHIRQLNSATEGLRKELSSLETRVRDTRAKIEQISAHMEHQNDSYDDKYSETTKQIGKQIDNMETKITSLEKNIKTQQQIVTLLNTEVQSNANTIKSIEPSRKFLEDQLNALEYKCKGQDRIIALKDVTLAEHDLKIQALEMASYDGILVWKITDFARKRRDSISGRALSIYSPYFFTGRHGYKLCARVYLNGDGMGKGNHVSLFFVVMKGEYDAILKWPFRQKVTLMWLDQSNREHVIDAFRPDPVSNSFQRPTGDMNIASGCPLFMPLNMLDSARHIYVKDDTAYVKIIVDTLDI
ncbi:TNF receptor-associated factor 2-like [Saccoglossus kowalevskii]